MLGIGDPVKYKDEVGQDHIALITANWDPASETPCVNLLWVSNDPDKKDSYGRQMERNSSVQHKSSAGAPGRYWDYLNS